MSHHQISMSTPDRHSSKFSSRSRIDVVAATYFEPIQFRDPVENGLKDSFWSFSKRGS